MMGETDALLALRRDGSTFPAEISLAPLTVGGRQLTLVGLRDVTGPGPWTGTGDDSSPCSTWSPTRSSSTTTTAGSRRQPGGRGLAGPHPRRGFRPAGHRGGDGRAGRRGRPSLTAPGGASDADVTSVRQSVLQRSDGALIPVEVHARVVPATGSDGQVIALVARDTRDRRRRRTGSARTRSGSGTPSNGHRPGWS